MRTNRSCYSELAIAREQRIFGRDSRAGKGVEKLYLGKPQVCSDWRLLAWENWRWANKKQGILGDWFGEFLWLLLSWKRGEKKGSCKLLNKSWPFWADCCRGCGLASHDACSEDLVKVLLSYMVWLLSICVFSLSVELGRRRRNSKKKNGQEKWT